VSTVRATSNQPEKEIADELPRAEEEGRARAEEVSRLFREHNRALIRFVLTRVSNEQEAKEIAQEAYVQLLELDQGVAIGYLRWYLFTIAKRIATDRYRQNHTRSRLDQKHGSADLELASPTEDSVLAADELAQLMSALKELPPKCQHAFLLHKLRGLSTTEVAAQLGITDRMVRNHLQKALAYCRMRVDGVTAQEAKRRVES
jgi:RNA polymerase sigma factor (sigma-70 family)